VTRRGERYFSEPSIHYATPGLAHAPPAGIAREGVGEAETTQFGLGTAIRVWGARQGNLDQARFIIMPVRRSWYCLPTGSHSITEAGHPPQTVQRDPGRALGRMTSQNARGEILQPKGESTGNHDSTLGETTIRRPHNG